MCVASSIFDSARTKRQSCRPPNTQDSGNEDLVFRNLLLAESTIVHSHYAPFGAHLTLIQSQQLRDRKSTRLNSSHVASSYAVFCLKKKNATLFNILIVALHISS